MCWSEQVAVVIPCLDEEITIHSLVREARGYLPSILVIDDGSTDRTADEARRAGAQVLTQPVSRGKGAALHAGFAAALGAGFEWALAMDGDGQHAPGDIPAFLARAKDCSATMLVGNRMDNCRAMPPLRRLANRWMSAEIGRFCETKLSDSQCGYRLVNLAAWSRLHFTADHFEIESELIVRFLHAGFPIGFVPVQTRYGTERSKIRPLHDTIRWCRWWCAIRKELSRREPRYVATPQDATA